MHNSRGWLTLAATTLLCGGVAAALAAPAPPAPLLTPNSGASPQASAFFETKVRPILVARCFSCHSSSSKPIQGGLKLDSREALVAGGVRGAALTPGDPDRSSLIRALSYADKDLRMPPAGKLPAAEIAALTAWVNIGAPWPAALANSKADLASTRPTTAFWAWQSPKAPAVPRVKNAKWVRNPVDAFVLAGLEARGLAPAPTADRRTLIRRATFDLTGLPPTPREVREFLADSRPDAFARVVDRLLASSAYGERWGRHWLDVARYADSNGLDENLVYTNAWRYRDYVIRAFNQDKPIDRFIQEQIAGDLLPGDADDFDRVVATGYLSLGAKMLAEDDPVKQEEDILDEQVDTLGKTFMGLTLGCARCHDHKFDPFPQTDYYSLAGIFKSTRTMRTFSVVAEWQELPLVSAAVREKLEAAEAAIKAKRSEQARRRDAATRLVLADAHRREADYLRAARELVQSGTMPVPTAVLAAPGTSTPPEAVVVEAEDFVRGNVLRDLQGYGKGIGVLVNAGQYPNFAEYEVSAAQAAPYQLDLRYASGDARGIRISINGSLVASTAANKVTGGFFPDAQRWFSEGVFQLRAGKNVIRLERDSFFPHIDKLLLLPRVGQSFTRSPEQIAAEAGLVPDFLAQAVTQVKEAGARPPAALAFTLPDNATRLLPPGEQAELKRQDDEIAALEKAKPEAPRAMAVSEGAPTNMKVHVRGNYLTLGKECPRGFPAILAGSAPPEVAPTQSGRLELARWMTRADHPLTARVFVNRAWRWHFGQGIVPSVDNFGKLGERPTNQPLLDWLASSFAGQSSGQPRTLNSLTPWSLKSLHRLIMLSNTYQMSSRYDARAARVDPENRLHWRTDRRRLEAEAIRDSILAVSGRLDREMGGSLLKFKDRQYVTSTANADPVDYRSTRRSVYLPVIRSALYDVYTAFDFGDPSVMNGDRASTTVAPQVLFLMNSSVVLESTHSMAKTLLANTALNDGGRIRLAYELCYGRPASDGEVRRALELLQRLQAAYATAEPRAETRNLKCWQSLCKAFIAASEFIYID